ncbi:hsp90 co-chaperone Cdc37-like 1 isoform X2 [Ambystoma mexicanum]|uniref:hsp90 co-chaperone Cdc37-like 1 isoform X2 n=1 Tax=Ambystoma mexicanum TaxID=8296 RepID=UPI0037E9720C
MASIYNTFEMECSRQKVLVKSSVECKWNLAEAQLKLCSLALHNSESMDQEQAKSQTEVSELELGEEEWKQKEDELLQEEGTKLWNVDTNNHYGFNKSFINLGKGNQINEEDKAKPFIQKYEGKIRHFGMLNRWSDSQRFLADFPDLVCEETSNYLLLWCFVLEAEQKRALMEQVAHQAVVMQFILEMAKSCNVDPRGCFRVFFQKAQAGGGGYSEAFKSELEAFKERVRQLSDPRPRGQAAAERPGFCLDLGPAAALESQPKIADSSLACYLNMELCNFSGTGCQGDEESKMMDTA